MSFLVAVRPASALSLKKPFFSSRVRARASLVVSLGTATLTLSSLATAEAAVLAAAEEAVEAVEEEPPQAVRAAAAAATPVTFRKSRRVIIAVFPLYFIKCFCFARHGTVPRPCTGSPLAMPSKKAPVLTGHSPCKDGSLKTSVVPPCFTAPLRDTALKLRQWELSSAHTAYSRTL